mmetsp:Transcript_53429/g.125665  ORF Transcript_53429/g.125665 Transcript_53429/m.125665 type:complete len:93 (-) Transcript_53429:74-352(-)
MCDGQCQLHELGVLLLYKIGDLPLATETLRKALQMARLPQHKESMTQTMYAMADVLKQQGEVSEAEAILRKALALDSRHRLTDGNVHALLYA